jgi:hypothetical protein
VRQPESLVEDHRRGFLLAFSPGSLPSKAGKIAEKEVARNA